MFEPGSADVVVMARRTSLRRGLLVMTGGTEFLTYGLECPVRLITTETCVHPHVHGESHLMTWRAILQFR